MDLAADLALFYADYGVEAIHTPQGGVASVPKLVIFDQPGQVVLGGEVLATDYGLRYPVGTFPRAAHGDSFQIGGVSYTAREQAQYTLDGQEFTVALAKA